ncbi:patatin-like phospholipase family protein [Shimia thalassica]|uniref:patatin-like phospholipase family protein n=1 Tax=Shimia thalassica TaxID=1715693 RepID=UPI001C086792|nr:patatin-like phospholipase family protein [Shimia thalassica]MBU2941833.1 patatin-like phospholipase family protein [Shimia thalassica]MDO6503785.1 patatin-like phospholipase family protein [Shimia thalassica]
MTGTDRKSETTIAISLSGGGARAMAFHLGCLRALKAAGILEHTSVLSCVSGGSVIGAIYVTHEGSFESFEKKVRETLRTGFVRPALWTALTSREGLRAAFCRMAIFGRRITSLLLAPLRWSVYGVTAMFGMPTTGRVSPVTPRRLASRTTILAETFDRLLFEGKTLKDIEKRKPKFVAVASELRTGTAFYFSPNESGSWRFGKVNPDSIKVARAVAASAAYPLLLPALDENYIFNKSDGSARNERITLTDGGVYDNRGLAPLWPDRDSAISVKIPKPDVIIACRAGYGLRLGEPTVTLLGRMTASFYTSLDRAQNAALKRLFDLRSAGELQAIVLPYLAQADARLACAPSDLVKREDVDAYPTNFSAMTEEWIERLSKRGEQVTLAVLKEHHPELLNFTI